MALSFLQPLEGRSRRPSVGTQETKAEVVLAPARSEVQLADEFPVTLIFGK
ncbi:MAG: hypothetical protein WAX69_06635 [Victivallales bacterium]